MTFEPYPRGDLRSAKLNIATPESVEGISRRRLRRGVLHVDLTPRLKPRPVGPQAPFSGSNFSRRCPMIPMLLQFPVEILKNILSYLEPIWLFQLAAAYPETHTILNFETSNRIWYDAVPAALFLEPESFQDELSVKHRMKIYSKGAGRDPTLQLSTSRLIYDAFHYRALFSSRFVVPAITSLSEISITVDFNVDPGHPRDRRFYPTTPTRIRNMALGGPFQPWLDYKRELAGHLHCGMRCFICFDLAGRCQQYKQIGGMIWCSSCYKAYTLTSSQIAEIPGLDRLLRHSSSYSNIDFGLKSTKFCYRPMVDEVLRSKIGVDFGTASSIQAYMSQLLETWRGKSLSTALKAHRRQLRKAIASRAQLIWSQVHLEEDQNDIGSNDSSAALKGLVKMIVVHARQRWATVTQVPNFLFPARLLLTSAEWLPDNPHATWLHDPTLDLKTSQEVLRIRPEWVQAAAKKMVEDLVSCLGGSEVTSWMEAAADWHVQRLKHEIFSGKYLNLQYGGERSGELQNTIPNGKNRLEIIAKKLRIDPLFSVGTLTPHEKQLAVACFNKILVARCAACPKHNLLVLPSGLEEVVRHYRDHHTVDFFLSDAFAIRG